MKKKQQQASINNDDGYLVLSLVHQFKVQESRSDIRKSLFRYKTICMVLKPNVNTVGLFESLGLFEGPFKKKFNATSYDLCIGLCKVLRWQYIREMLSLLHQVFRLCNVCKNINIDDTFVQGVIGEMPVDFKELRFTVSCPSNPTTTTKLYDMVGTFSLSSRESVDILHHLCLRSYSAFPEAPISRLSPRMVVERIETIAKCISMEGGGKDGSSVCDIIDEIVLDHKPIELSVFRSWVRNNKNAESIKSMLLTASEDQIEKIRNEVTRDISPFQKRGNIIAILKKKRPTG